MFVIDFVQVQRGKHAASAETDVNSFVRAMPLLEPTFKSLLQLLIKDCVHDSYNPMILTHLILHTPHVKPFLRTVTIIHELNIT